MAVDSGACATVANPEDIPNHPVLETPESKAGAEFVAASGDPTPNLGGMKVPIITEERTQRLMNVTAAPVLKPLMIVKELCASGHMVILDEEASYIMNKMTGEINYLREDNGNYMLDCWVPPHESGFGGHL